MPGLRTHQAGRCSAHRDHGLRLTAWLPAAAGRREEQQGPRAGLTPGAGPPPPLRALRTAAGMGVVMVPAAGVWYGGAPCPPGWCHTLPGLFASVPGGSVTLPKVRGPQNPNCGTPPCSCHPTPPQHCKLQALSFPCLGPGFQGQVTPCSPPHHRLTPAGTLSCSSDPFSHSQTS